jgi:hypothetical protein
MAAREQKADRSGSRDPERSEPDEKPKRRRKPKRDLVAVCVTCHRAEAAREHAE